MAGFTDYQGSAGIVTGASSGIGAQLARDLAARGMRVALLARRADRLAALADEIRRGGGEAIAVPCDVAERTSIEGAGGGRPRAPPPRRSARQPPGLRAPRPLQRSRRR